MYEEESGQSPSNILPAVMRYKWHLAAVIPLLLLLSIFGVVMLPPVYRSYGMVMVETQQIPVDLVQTTVTAAASEQIDIIRQRVMTRDNLLSIIKKYPYFGIEKATPLEIVQGLNYFRDNIFVEVQSAKNGRNAVAIGFIVSFASESPAISQAVTNDLVNLFLSENVKARTMRASETTEFLSTEAAKIRDELTEIETKVADFKRENKDALPEHLDLYANMREDTRKGIDEIEQNIGSYNEQINILNTQLSLARQQSGAIVGADADIKALRENYRNLLVRYTPEHPDVVALRDQIRMLESGAATEESGEAIYSGAELDIRNQISALQAKIAQLELQKKQEVAKLEDLQQRIIKIPLVERGFVSIKRDYETKINQYNEIVAKTQNAEMAESLEQQQKAERFSLLEPPILPTTPSEPDRQKLLALSAFFSIGFPAGIVFLIGFLDKSIRDSDTLEKIVGSPPLIEIPYIETIQERSAHKRRLVIAAAGVVSAAILGIVLLHFLYMPLDMLIYKIAARFGL
jgi:succinoglycan biosynthesis transport protein ExoP